jgi:hypothetical protein
MLPVIIITLLLPMLRRYLSDQHDATTIGVLLGMSACCRASADTTVARMLFLHLPARHPNNFPEIELSPHVQVRQDFSKKSESVTPQALCSAWVS